MKIPYFISMTYREPATSIQHVRNGKITLDLPIRTYEDVQSLESSLASEERADVVILSWHKLDEGATVPEEPKQLIIQ